MNSKFICTVPNNLLSEQCVNRMYKFLTLFFQTCIHNIGFYTLLLAYNLYNLSIKFMDILDKVFRSRFDSKFSSLEYNDLYKEIENDTRTLKKIPLHLLLIFGTEEPSYKDIAKLISWSLPAGIKFISFYDHKAKLDPLSVFNAISDEHKKCLHQIKWGKSFSEEVKEFSHKQINGYVWQPRLQVNLYDLSEGQAEMVEAVRELHRDGVEEVLHRELDRFLSWRIRAPPPDLALVCGPTLSYYSCLPWHLRLTQFLLVRSHHEIKVKRFLDILHEYSKSEQRYGK